MSKNLSMRPAAIRPWLVAFNLFLALLAFPTAAQAQFYILGRGLDDQETPYGGAIAELHGEDFFEQQICTGKGVFRFNNLKPGQYELVLITAYGIRRKSVELKGSVDITLTVPRNMTIDEISVVANRAGEREPVTHTNLYAAEIGRRDVGLDMPYVLENTPSVVTTSDAGIGIGYTGLRLRGTDPTRINVTLNGVPVNDAESHTVFWVDLPDLASSSTSIQVQRGIGWSQPGSGDFGGSIQINSMGFEADPYGLVKAGLGSFGSRRLTAGGGTGLIKGRFTLDGRASYIASDGYIDRAESRLYSLYGMAGYHHDASNLRLIVAHGKENTYQAWNGVPAQYIDDPILRTYNSAGAERPGQPYDNEIDDYRQTHTQLHFDKTVTPFARWVNTVFYTRGKGYFEQYKAGQVLADYGIADTATADLVRQRWLDNHFYGFNTRLQFGRPEHRYFYMGGGWNLYQGRHFGEVSWVDGTAARPNGPYYDNDARKRDWNLFARSNMRLTSHLDLTLDLQGRWIRYAFSGPDEDGQPVDQSVRHAFFNPKAGLRYVFNQNASLYLLTGLIHKEPNRDDYVESTPASRPGAERLWDTELGFRFGNPAWRVDLNGYAMKYKDHLVPTGRLNDVGAYTRVNVPDCSRLGMEVGLAWTGVKHLEIGVQATLSRNRIDRFDEYVDDWDTGIQAVVVRTGTPLAFSPELLANMTAGWMIFEKPKQDLRLTVTGRYVGDQYADNTGLASSRLDAYTVLDGGVEWNVMAGKTHSLTLKAQVRNLMDSAYESNGWVYRFRSAGYDPVPDDPYAVSEGDGQYILKGYFPQAGRNLWLQAEWRF